MQAYIKDGNLIVNDLVQDSEKEPFNKFIYKAIKYGINTVALYNIEGEVSGIEFITKKGE